MRKSFFIACIGAVIAGWPTWPVQVQAGAPAPAAAQAEIAHLLSKVGSSGCEFFRNGSWYGAQQAQAFLPEPLK